MTASELKDALHELLVLEIEEEQGVIERVRTYAEIGLLSRDEGLVVQTRDGSQFEIIIVKYK